LTKEIFVCCLYEKQYVLLPNKFDNKIFFRIMEKSVKQVKLHGKRRSSATGLGKDVPWLNINGLWLERAGFGIGQSVEIEVEAKKLTIKAL
jgi:toxic protein SymE